MTDTNIIGTYYMASKQENQQSMLSCIYIVKTIENKEKTSCIFLDFAKAFDTKNHEILLGKLEFYRVRSRSYLSNRKQSSRIG